MSGEVNAVWGNWKTLESAGVAIASGSVAQADDAGYSVVTDGLNFPDAEFVLTGAFASAPVEGTTLMLYAQPLAADGTNNAEVPEATRPTVLIGAFVVNNVTTQQTIPINGVFAVDLPQNANYYVHNNGTGQSLSAGWKLLARPRTRKVAA